MPLHQTKAYAQWNAFVKANQIDASKVKIENVGFPVREPLLAQGKVHAITGFSFSSYINLKSKGVAEDDMPLILMREHGLTCTATSSSSTRISPRRTPTR